MLPNYSNFTCLSDQAFYAVQEIVPPLPAQISFESEPQFNEVMPIEAASAAASMCQPRRRTGRSDRHSKIRTAQGERDRRMRLSVNVAHQFFALQDRLGFDKASKTIDWLLTQAKDSIDQLSTNSSPRPSKEKIPSDLLPQSRMEPMHATETAQKRNKAAEQQLKAKELRAMARERARERAREKKMVSSQLDQIIPPAATATATADAPVHVDCNDIECYYDLLNEILNGGLCSVDIEDEEGATSAGLEFN